MYSEYLMIKISPNMKEKLKAISEKQDKTISDYVRGLIVEDMENKK